MKSDQNKENKKPSCFFLSPELVNSLSTDQCRTHIIETEYKLLYDGYCQLSGVYCIPQLDDIHKWHCIIFVKDGLYQNAKFKFVVEFPKSYPKSRPEIRFMQKIYHPLIDQEGNLDMNALLPEWSFGQNQSMYTVFIELKNIFSDINYLSHTNSFNKIAAEKFSNDIEEFCQQVLNNVEESNKVVYNNYEGTSMKFSQFNSVHEKILVQLKTISQNQDKSFEMKKQELIKILLQHEIEN